MKSLKKYINESLYTNIGGADARELIIETLKECTNIFDSISNEKDIDIKISGKDVMVSSSKGWNNIVISKGAPIEYIIHLGQFGRNKTMDISIGYIFPVSEEDMKSLFDTFQFDKVDSLDIWRYQGKYLPDNMTISTNHITINNCPKLETADLRGVSVVSGDHSVNLRIHECPMIKTIIPPESMIMDLELIGCPDIDIRNIKTKLSSITAIRCPKVNINSTMNDVKTGYSVNGCIENFIGTRADYGLKDRCTVYIDNIEDLRDLLDGGCIPRCGVLCVNGMKGLSSATCKSYIKNYIYQFPDAKVWSRIE